MKTIFNKRGENKKEKAGHSINPAIKLENFLTMHETLKKYGTYPIKVD